MCVSVRNLANGSLLESLETKGRREVQKVMISSPTANKISRRVGVSLPRELDHPHSKTLRFSLRSRF